MPPIMRDCDGVSERTMLAYLSKGPDTVWPVSMSQIRTVLSFEPETTRLPSRENAMDLTPSVCPSNRLEMVWPVSTSQMCTVLSPKLETTRFPSCENVMEVTSSMWSQLLITVGYRGSLVCWAHHHESVYVCWGGAGTARVHWGVCGAWARPKVGCRACRRGLGHVGEGSGYIIC